MSKYESSVTIGGIHAGSSHPLLLIAGPDVIESEASLLSHAERIAKICEKANVSYVVKSSYDKANRTSHQSFRGPGQKEGLKVLKQIKKQLQLPVLSDVHCKSEVDAAAEVLDILQSPAFLSRQTDLVMRIAQAGKAVNIKKGQFLAPWDMEHVIAKAKATGNDQILVTERGFSFGYNNLVSDMRSLQVMASFGCPVIFDGTHSVQLPGGGGNISAGQREFVPTLCRAAVATGFCHGLFLEIHEDPDNAPCDGANMLRLDQLPQLLDEIVAIRAAVSQASNTTAS